MKVRDVSTLIALLIAVIIINGYKWELVPREDGAYDYMPYMPPLYEQSIRYLGYLQLISSSVLLVGFWLNQRALVIKAGWRKRIEQNASTLQLEIKKIHKLREENLGKLNVEDIDMS